MSFRVNTNLMAMNALRNLESSTMDFSRSITRLSTGQRINSAADDPAGLISSESFRAQIGGIDQAIRNNQDAINYSKTAEGALDEVNRLLKDARSLAVASGNQATLSDTQKQANQSQLNSIITSISRIAAQTSFGQKKLLDGSAGTYAATTSGANVSTFSFSGNYGGAALTTNSVITVDMVTSATRATITGGRTFANATDTMQAGSFSINGVSFNTASTDTIADVVARINNSSNQTGVSASWTANGGVVLTNKNYGTDSHDDLVDSNGVLQTQAGAASSTGVNAVADVTIDLNGTAAGGLSTVTFDKGNGLLLRDSYGNAVQLTENGNLSMAAAAWGQVNAGTSIFQIGANAGETTSLSLGNMAASQLGLGAIAGKDLSNLDLTTQQGASEALQVIDKAIGDVASTRGQIGSFTRNILESNVRSLGIAKENLAATESAIRDTDIASEMTNFTKLQILQQSGLSVLAQANSAPQAVLSLLRGG